MSSNKIPPLKSQSVSGVGHDISPNNTSLSPRRRIVSRFHDHYDSESVAVTLRSPSQNPSFAGVVHDGSNGDFPQTLSGTSISGVYDASTVVMENKRSLGFLALDATQSEGADGLNATMSGKSPKVNDSSISEARHHHNNHHGGSAASPSPAASRARSIAAAAMGREASPSQPLLTREGARSLSLAATRIIDEEVQQIEYETQMAGAIVQAQIEQKRKDKERKIRRDNALSKITPGGMGSNKKESSSAASPNETGAVGESGTNNNSVTNSMVEGDAASLYAAVSAAKLHNNIAMNGSGTNGIQNGGGMSGATTQHESVLGSSISSQSELSEIDRHTSNSTPHHHLHGGNSAPHLSPHHANNGGVPGAWSDTVSIASDVVGSDMVALPPNAASVRPTSSSNGAQKTSGTDSNKKSAPNDGGSFWGGLFKKDGGKSGEGQTSANVATSAAGPSSTPANNKDSSRSVKSFFGSSPAESANNFSKVASSEQQRSDSAGGTASATPKPAAKEDAAVVSTGPSIQLQPLSLNLKAKVVIIGEQGSGKTSFKACFTSSVLKSMPEVAPSTQSSSTTFYFKSETTNKSTQQRRSLDVTVVDSGPLPLSAGVTNFYDDGTLFIMTLSLAGVKQKPPPKSLNPFGPKPVPEPIIYEGDRKLIRSHLQTIAAVAPRNAALFIVGTCMDLLSDTSQGAVEAVIDAVRNVVMAELSNEHYNIMFRGCFAVSCTDHKVTSDLRPTGPRYISDLWTMMCETMMKDAMSNKGGVTLQTPLSFGWSQDAITAAVDNLEETGWPVHSASSAPQLGNIANTLLAKFVAESTRSIVSTLNGGGHHQHHPSLEFGGGGDISSGARSPAPLSTASSVASFRRLNNNGMLSPTASSLIGGTGANPSNGSTHSASAAAYSNWLSNVTADHSFVVENASTFTVKMFKKSHTFGSVENHFARIQRTVPNNTNSTTAAASGGVAAAITTADGSTTTHLIEEPFARPCRSNVSTVATGFTDASQHEDSLDKPRSQQELLQQSNDGNKNPYAPTSLLSAEDEVTQLLLLRASSKALLFAKRAKTEMNFIVTSMDVLRQHFYALGVISKAHFHSIICILVREGDITVFKRQPAGRDDTILFQPHLISRAAFTVIRTAQLSSYPAADRKRLFPSVDAEESQVADPQQRLASSGVISDLLLIAMSGCLSPIKKNKGEAADLMQYLLVTSDFILAARESDPDRVSEPASASNAGGGHSNNGSMSGRKPSMGGTLSNGSNLGIGAAVTDDGEESAAALGDTVPTPSATNRISSYFTRQKKSKMEILLETDCCFMGLGYRFVAPSLVKKTVDIEGGQAIKAILQISNQAYSTSAGVTLAGGHNHPHLAPISLSGRGRKVRKYAADINAIGSSILGSNTDNGKVQQHLNPIVAHEHHINICPAPPFLRFKIMCRLARFIATPSCVSSNGVWLSNPQLMCRCLLKFDTVTPASPSAAAPSSGNTAAPIQTETLDFVCITSGSRVGALAFLEEIMKEIRNFLKYELRGSTITILRNPPSVVQPKDSKLQSVWKAWLSDGRNDKFAKLDELFMHPASERKPFLPIIS